MKIKYLIFIICIAALFFTAVFFIRNQFLTAPSANKNFGPTTVASVKFINSTITSNGSVTAQNRASLNFQTSGKLIYLPFKEGDTVTAGKTIAKLDTYALQRQLSITLNNYRATRDTFDQTQQNSQDNVLKPQLAPTFSDTTIDKNNAINDALKRIVDQSQVGLDNSVINVELANYAMQLSTLNSPLNGIILHQDVTVSGVNITPATTFVVADPSSMVFRANISMEDIYYINEGNTVSLAIDGIPDKLNGTVVKIYPSKVTLLNGQAVYQVDIASPELKKQAKFDVTGTAIININSENVALVPAWTVLSSKYIWTDDNGTPVLKQISVGKIHGNEIEITSGLLPTDKIIIDPKSIPLQKYKLL